MADKLKDLFGQIKEEKKQKEERSSSGRADKLLEIADELRTGLENGAEFVASNDSGEAVALYKKSSDGVLSAFSDKQLEAYIFRSYPQLLSKDTKEVMRLIKLLTFNLNSVDLSTVQPVCFADELDKLTWNRLRLKRSELARVTLDQLPAFKHILSLIDDPAAFTLWIGSLLDPKAGRAQYLHWYGSGGNGKSRLFDGLAEVLGPRHVVRTRADEFMNQHWGSSVEGARLLLFADENNPGFFSTGKFKEFTGEQTVTVNPKYEKPRQIRLTHKTAVFSNNRVEISANAADRRRLLSISIADDPDPNVGFRWWHEELGSSADKILAYCFHRYQEAVAQDPSVRAYIPQKVEVVEAAIERKYGELFDAIRDLYVVTGAPDDVLKRSEVHERLSEAMRERKTNRLFIQQVREALQKLGVTEGKGHGGASLYRGLRQTSLASLPTLVKGGAKP